VALEAAAEADEATDEAAEVAEAGTELYWGDEGEGQGVAQGKSSGRRTHVEDSDEADSEGEEEDSAAEDESAADDSSAAEEVDSAAAADAVAEPRSSETLTPTAAQYCNRPRSHVSACTHSNIEPEQAHLLSDSRARLQFFPRALALHAARHLREECVGRAQALDVVGRAGGRPGGGGDAGDDAVRRGMRVSGVGETGTWTDRRGDG